MADKQVREQQFSYVISPYQINIYPHQTGSRQDEPTGEPVSLAGRDLKPMGSLANREKPNLQKKTLQQQQTFNPKRKTKFQMSSRKTVLNQDIDENLLYRPKTKENRLVYEKILSLIYSYMPEQTQETIKSVVDEILAVMKNENSKDTDKKQEIEALIGKLTNEQFSDILLAAKNITDYNPNVDELYDNYEQEIRIPVMFDEDEAQDSSAEEIEQMVIEEGDEEDSENAIVEDKDGEAIKRKQQFEITNLEEENDKYYISLDKIDAYWLHASLNKIYNDPIKSQQMVEDVLTILSAPTDIECENQLVLLFSHENFDLIKTLHNNRHKIFFLTQLGKAQTDEQKEIIYNEMRNSQEGSIILEQLQKKRLPQKMDIEKITPQPSNNNNDDIAKKLTEAINVPMEEFANFAKQTIDLEGMVFDQGSHFMSNEKCHLPPGSIKVTKKGYEEIQVPAVKHKSFKDKLIKIEELPKWAQGAFKGVKELNLIQTRVCQQALFTPENILVCAPTGAGKTNIALLTMLQVIGNYINDSGDVDLTKFKMVYIAPMKALVNEMVLNFQKRLECFGIKVAELTGDTHLTKQQIKQTQLLIATPEKWDILTRKINNFISLVRLLIIDEIHLLHDLRGPVLEAIVARTIRQIEERQEFVRIVGLSATLPNYADVAAFIRVKAETGIFYFDNTYRPVPLEQRYIGITEKKAIRKMILMNEILYEKVQERAGKSQILIFVHSRKETVKTAKLLKEMAFSKDDLNKFVKDDGNTKKVLEEVLQREDIRSADLRELIPWGFAVHHAGLSRGDRDLVEQLFTDKHIQVLVSTSTLAWGVNLPAHTVIIKGTQVYSPEQGRWVELSPQDILQMIGRAGRPRFDTKGEGIIITSYQELKFYLSLLNMQLPIESQFITQLADQLNAEVSLGSIHNLKDAVNWLGYTYLYVRMLRNPFMYQVQDQQVDPLLVRKRLDLVHSAATLLDKHGLCKYDRRTGILEPTSLGKISSNYYIKYPSMAIYHQHLKPNMGMIELMKVFSLSQEFKLIPIREEEKVELQKLQVSVPVPIKGSPDDPTTKVNVLLQAYISRLKLEGFALNSDMVYVTQSAARIMRSIFEICLQNEWAQASLNALSLSKMVEKRMWGCMTPLRQFQGLPEEILKRIEKKEGVTWDHIYNMSAQQIGELIRYPNLGKTVHKLVHKFPRIDIKAFVQPITRSCLRIDLELTPDFLWDEKMHGKQEPFQIFVLDCDCERILYHEPFVMKYKLNKSYGFSFTVPLFEIMHPLYFIRVVSDRWISCEAEQAIPFKNLILPEPFSRVTELLQYQPIPIEELKCPAFEKMLMKKILPPHTTHFDSIQTQTFKELYKSQENLFIGCPSYQSKNILPYIAILAQIQRGGGKCVYISPQQTDCDQKFRDLVLLFSKSGIFNCKVAQLTGQVQTDVKLLESADIIIANSQQWDIISRRWRTRKGFNQIKLFVCDNLHLIGEFGSILEVIVSRMRLISVQCPLRIVGLSLSVADYREMSEWIGANLQFNFSPQVRTNPVEYKFQSFDQAHRPTRIQVMLKWIYQQIKQRNTELWVIYVSDRKQARLSSLDLMSSATADGSTFLSVQDTDVKEVVEQIQGDQYLQYTLNYGIGFLYECMNEKDEQVVLNLIKIRAINVVILTHKLAMHHKIKGNNIVILDCQKYDGLEKRYVDYTIPEMLEMVESDEPRCYVLVHTSKKEFYKKFLYEPQPVESHLNHFLSNHLNAEIVAKNIHSTQDCIDWITWSFMYRRLTQNPNYYNLSEVSGTAINNYLSELIENTLDELKEAKCIAIEEDCELEAINSGIIANYYYINVLTVANFTELINDKSTLRDLLLCLSQASEFETIQIRNSEEIILQLLAKKINFEPTNVKFNEPNTKAFILLQAYFSRIPINSDLKFDLNQMLELAVRLSSAMVDVASSNLWLKPAILCMQLCQMLVQALWINEDSQLKQIPYLGNDVIEKLKHKGVLDISDLMNMDDDDRNEALSQFNQEEIENIAKACNRFPSIEIKNLVCDKIVTSGEVMQVIIELERVGLDQDYSDIVIAPHYPKPKEESWWVLCADKRSNRLFGNKKVNFRDFSKIDLRFQAPEPGDYELTVFSMCDSYIGADQVVQLIGLIIFQAKVFKLKVIPPEVVEIEEEVIEEPIPIVNNQEGMEGVQEIVQDIAEEVEK